MSIALQMELFVEEEKSTVARSLLGSLMWLLNGCNEIGPFSVALSESDKSIGSLKDETLPSLLVSDSGISRSSLATSRLCAGSFISHHYLLQLCKNTNAWKLLIKLKQHPINKEFPAHLFLTYKPKSVVMDNTHVTSQLAHTCASWPVTIPTFYVV